MLSCREVMRLVSDGLDRELSVRQRIGMRLHALMCRACRRCKRQIETIDLLIGDYYGSENHIQAGGSDRLSPGFRERVKGLLRGP